MIIQHNLMAMNANRMLNVTTSKQSKATEKLSSGYRINRAADDAAGLSISEKMRKQINGLDQASTNAQDGVSAVQTAEGALTEVHSMLQRMNELAVQAANGTNSEDDRQAIQEEVNQLTTEIDRVAETTKFNETYLLKGGNGTKVQNLVPHDAGIKGTLTDNGDGTATFTMDALYAGDKVSIGGKEYTTGFGDDDVDKFFKDNANTIQDTDGKKVTLNGVDLTYHNQIAIQVHRNPLNQITGYTCGYEAGWYNIWQSTHDTNHNIIHPSDYKDVDALKAAAKTSGATLTAGANTMTYLTDDNGDGVDDYDRTVITAQKAYMLAQQELLAANQIGDTMGSARVGTMADPNVPMTLKNATNNFGIHVGQASVAERLSFNLHVGADADMSNKIQVDIETMNADYLGIKGLNVKDDTGMAATYAIDAIGDAASKVSAQRSALGAVQNRLEHTIANVDNVVENTTAAESRIRDTDMAKMMVEFSKNNIIAQAGQSMLAQANQSTQGVLSLLQQ